MCIVQKRLWQIQGVFLKPITDCWDLGYIKGYSIITQVYSKWVACEEIMQRREVFC